MSMRNHMTFYARKQSFLKYGWEAPSPDLTPKKMAQAGFYCITKDCVKCSYCFKELEGWEPGDEPFTEHRKHEPRCPFVNMFTAPPESMNCLEALELGIRASIFKNETEYEKIIKELDSLL